MASTDKSFAIIHIVAMWKLLNFRPFVFKNFPGSSVVGVILDAARLGIAGGGKPGEKPAGGEGEIDLWALTNHEQSNLNYGL